MLSIRRAQIADHEMISALWEEARLETVTLEEWDTLITSPSAIVLLGEEDEALEGAVVAAFDGWRAYIYHIAVVPGRRQRGVAQQLISAAEDEVRELGARLAYIMVEPENLAGMALTKGLGYAPNGEIVKTKQLSAAAEAASPASGSVS